MPTSFLNLVNDDGSNTVGTLIDKAEIQALLMGTYLTRTDTGAVNNWAPGVDGHTFTAWAGASDATFSGCAGGQAGLLHVVRNTGTKVAYFLHASGLSSAANQYANSVTSGATPIAPGGYIAHRHTGSVWQLVAHEQGAWIAPAWVQAHFTGNGSMTWLVEVGDVGTSRYRLTGRTVTYAFNFLTTTIAGTPNTQLQISNAQWGGYTIAAVIYQQGMAFANDGTVRAAYSQAPASGTAINLITTAATAWAAVVNAGYFAGTITAEVA